MPYKPIEDYGIIGDQCTAALVGVDGSIDFMCFPSFDSPSVFAALLDDKKGGCFQLSPFLDDLARKQQYLPDSNMLLTRFLSPCGIAEISDFMAVADHFQNHELVRRVKTIKGDIEYRMVCDPRFDYARASHRVERTADGAIFQPDNGRLPGLRLRSSVPVELNNGRAEAQFKLTANKTASFVLELATMDGESASSSPDFVSHSFKTLNYWQQWVSRSHYHGRWREIVTRSALVLKLLTSAEHGSISAAPTFSLPEVIGGSRNWDYRYTWIRDASFTIYALMRLGYSEEANHFTDWITKVCTSLPAGEDLRVMYRLDGGAELEEEVLSHFEGYRKSGPVRIGNAAQKQPQLDIYGELLDSVYLALIGAADELDRALGS